MLTIDPTQIPTSVLHGFLLSAVAPRPIAFASTIDAQGNPNLSPFSFFNVFSANPPILIFSPARRVSNNTTKHTLANVQEVKEVVINVINYSMVHQASLASTEYPKEVNEFEKAGFTMLASETVKPFRVAESPVQMECKVINIQPMGEEGGAGNLVICEVLKMHIDKTVLNEEGQIDQHKLDLVARAGGSYYTRAKSGFFEIPKPLRNLGIGVDQLPKEIRESVVLTGNDLGMLANVEELPTAADVDNFVSDNPEYMDKNTIEKHKFAQRFLAQQDVDSAWKVLLIKNI
ncbi:flavin reductase [Flavobacteriaceae bacterium F08102]|nr:flavin reductase [Flavobacteriaceae bacterium F08102]